MVLEKKLTLKALIEELKRQKIRFDIEYPIRIIYKDKSIDEYRLDMVVEGKIIVELKAVNEMHPRFEAQLLSYLKASGLRLGLLANFGSDELEIKRFLNPHYK